MLKRNIYISNSKEYKKQLLSASQVDISGIIRYNPQRSRLKDNKSCCVIEVDSGVSDFYRNQVNKHYGMNLVKPSWSTHISVIQGEETKIAEKNLKFWKKHEGKEVSFKYSVFPRFSGDINNEFLGDCGWFWFLDVECELINTIRNELGLAVHKNIHLTIGRKWS